MVDGQGRKFKNSVVCPYRRILTWHVSVETTMFYLVEYHRYTYYFRTDTDEIWYGLTLLIWHLYCQKISSNYKGFSLFLLVFLLWHPHLCPLKNIPTTTLESWTTFLLLCPLKELGKYPERCPRTEQTRACPPPRASARPRSWSRSRKPEVRASS